METRMPEALGKIFSDDDGEKYEGLRYITFPDETKYLGEDQIAVYYHNGKIHREDGPALSYSDGYEESWLDGEFKGIYSKPFSERNS